MTTIHPPPCRPPRRTVGRGVLLAAAIAAGVGAGAGALLLATPTVAATQEIRGVVRDAATGDALLDVLVRAEPSGSVALTGGDGSFSLRRLGAEVESLTFHRIGYEATTMRVEGPGTGPLEVELTPAPLPVEGFEVRTASFETRFTEVETALDRRLALFPGTSRVVGPESLRRFDDVHAEDPWRHLTVLLGIEQDFHQDAIRVGWGGPSRVRPDVYIDDRPRWLFQLVETPTSSLCRIEVYRPAEGWAPNRPQLRAYTCFFLARVADAQQDLRKRMHWGEMIAGPWIG